MLHMVTELAKAGEKALFIICSGPKSNRYTFLTHDLINRFRQLAEECPNVGTDSVQVVQTSKLRPDLETVKEALETRHVFVDEMRLYAKDAEFIEFLAEHNAKPSGNRLWLTEEARYSDEIPGLADFTAKLGRCLRNEQNIITYAKGCKGGGDDEQNPFDDAPYETHAKVQTIFYEQGGLVGAIAAAVRLLAPRVSGALYVVGNRLPVGEIEAGPLTNDPSIAGSFPGGIFSYNAEEGETTGSTEIKDLNELPTDRREKHIILTTQNMVMGWEAESVIFFNKRNASWSPSPIVWSRATTSLVDVQPLVTARPGLPHGAGMCLGFVQEPYLYRQAEGMRRLSKHEYMDIYRNKGRLPDGLG